MSQSDDDKTRMHLVLAKDMMVAHYQIERKIGAGGMGEVYLADDTKLKRKVALKFLPAHLSTNNEIRERFVREAQTVAKLNHPNIVSIFDVSEFNDRPYYVMEWVEGEQLHYYCHEKPLPTDEIIEFAIQICQGLGEAHRAGVVHRDIKAANIAVDKNHRIKILDFGLAANEDYDKITKTGSTLGTVAYMSPEQVSGRDIDHRSDLFSFGIVLYELLAGRTPFRRDNEGATLKAIMTDNPEPIARYRSDVPDRLQQIMDELLEKDKELRFQSAEGVIAALKRLTYDSMPTGTYRTIEKKSSKKPLLISLVTLVVIIAAVVGYFLSGQESSSAKSNVKTPMIAVLPFQNLGPAADDYFADGITDEITSRLAGIKGLGVISRSSAIQYRDTEKNLKQIGKELGVQYILEGTVRWSTVGDQPKVRITPQLIEVSDDRHLWADNYERNLNEVFAVQADIAEKIVQQLGVTLFANDRENLLAKPTDNPEAYRLYLKALELKNDERRGFEVRGVIDSVIRLDPNFALAQCLKSEIYSDIAFKSPNSEDAKIAMAAAEKAMELAPGIPQAHLALGYYYNQVETDYERALEEYSLAKSEMHNNSELLRSIAYVYMRQGRFEEAVVELERATQLDPLNDMIYFELSQSYGFSRQFTKSIEATDRAITLKPEAAQHYFIKMLLLKNIDRDLTRVKATFFEGLKNLSGQDSVMFVIGNPDLIPYIPEFPFDSVFNNYIASLKDTALTDTAIVFTSMQYYGMSGRPELAAKYVKRAVEYNKDNMKKHPDYPYAAAHMGLILAVAGDCDEAEEYGQRGKELMSIDECHY